MEPTVSFKLWGVAGLYFGLRMYVGGNADLADAAVTLTAPQPNQVFRVDQSIPLNANVNGGIELSLYTGLELTAGIAGGDPETCEVNQGRNSGSSCNDPCLKYYQADGVNPLPPPNKTPRPTLPPTIWDNCLTHSQNKPRRQCYSGGPFQSHHIIQEAAVRGINGYPNTVSSKAYAVLLPYAAHQLANAAQPRPRGSGTYASERLIAQNALTAAGLLSSTQINKQLGCVDTFFYGLGFQSGTPTTNPVK